MYDVIIIGGGLSALSLLNALPENMKIALVMDEAESSSMKAQGGVSCSLFESSIDQHVMDTYNAGCQQGDIDVIRKMIQEGNAVIKEYIAAGMPFDKEGRTFALGLEGAHTLPRILHIKDQTGKYMCNFLKARYSASVDIYKSKVSALMRNKYKDVIGVELTSGGQLIAPRTVLATGGYSGLFYPASNTYTGGAAMQYAVYEAGCTLKDLAYIQFHPTLFIQDDRTICLISEALRGQGAKLVNETGAHIMASTEQQDLAARHIVSRTIYEQIKRGHKVYLDISEVENFSMQFPYIHSMCELLNITTHIPVAPGAHYTMGGIEAAIDGQTNIGGLFVIGEAACTGFHGASRLASNSLLEAVAMGAACAKRCLEEEHRDLTVSPFYTVNIEYPEYRLSTQLMHVLGIERDPLVMEDFKNKLGNDVYSKLIRLIIEDALRKPSIGAHQKKVLQEG